MEKESPSQRVLQDFSTILAALLPLAQLFFTQLPQGLTQIFQAPKYFTGISLVTLVVSYVLMAAYQSRPWFLITLPFQRDKVAKYNDYTRTINEASSAKQFVAGEQATTAKIDDFLKNLKTAPAKQPRQIGQKNIIAVSVAIIFINALAFVTIGQIYHPPRVWVLLQSISYILLISFTALALTIYYQIGQINRRSESDKKIRTKKAIDLATFSNCFGAIPQAKFISGFDDANVPSNYHVYVECDGQKYEIVTDYRAQQLIAVYPFG